MALLRYTMAIRGSVVADLLSHSDKSCSGLTISGYVV